MSGWMMAAFIVGAIIGLMTGISWGGAILDAVRADAAKTEKELIAEIMHLRKQVAGLIGK